MFSKVANTILFFRLDLRMGLLYVTLCLGECRVWVVAAACGGRAVCGGRHLPTIITPMYNFVCVSFLAPKVRVQHVFNVVLFLKISDAPK